MSRTRACWAGPAAALLLLTVSACTSATGAATPSATEDATSAVYGGCADRPLAEALAGWAGETGGAARAKVRLTGRTAETEDGVYSELQILSPKTIAGRPLPVDAGWVAGGASATGQVRTTRGTEGALWAPDGGAVVVVDPSHAIAADPTQLELHIAPLVGDDVVLSNAGCWNDSSLSTRPFTGEVAEVPGSQTADAVRPSLRAYAYASFVGVAKHALGAG